MMFLRYSTLNGADASASINGLAIDVSKAIQISAQVITTGDAAGTLKLQVSNDAPVGPQYEPTAQPTNWNDIPSATVTISAAGTLLIPKTDVCYDWIRVVYTRSSGAGTITVNVKTLSM